MQHPPSTEQLDNDELIDVLSKECIRKCDRVSKKEEYGDDSEITISSTEESLCGCPEMENGETETPTEEQQKLNLADQTRRKDEGAARQDKKEEKKSTSLSNEQNVSSNTKGKRRIYDNVLFPMHHIDSLIDGLEEDDRMLSRPPPKEVFRTQNSEKSFSSSENPITGTRIRPSSELEQPLNIATAQDKLSVPAAATRHEIVVASSSDPNIGKNLYQGGGRSAVSMTSGQKDIISAKQLHSNGGGNHVSSPKETKKDVVSSAVDSSVEMMQQHKDENKIGGSLRNTTRNMEQQCQQDDVVINSSSSSRSLSPNTTTTTTTAEKPKRKSSLTTSSKQMRGGSASGGRVLPHIRTSHFPHYETISALYRSVPLSTQEAINDLCTIKQESQKCSSMSAKILSSRAFQEGQASSSIFNDNNNSNSTTGNDKGSLTSSFGTTTRESSRRTRHLNQKEFLSAMALRTSMKLKTMSNKRRNLNTMIRIEEKCHDQSKLISALMKNNSALATGVLARLRLGAALSDLCLTLKKNDETIESEKCKCVDLEKMAIQMDITLPSSREEETSSTTTVPVKSRVERGTEEALENLYSRLLSANVTSQNMKGRQFEETFYSPLLKTTLQALKQSVYDKKVVFGGFESAETESPEFRRKKALSLNISGGAKAAAAACGGGEDNDGESLDYLHLTKDYSQREADNGSSMAPYVWEYYPLACPTYNSPLFLSPLSRRPDFVVSALSGIKNDNEQPIVRVRGGDDAEKDTDMIKSSADVQSNDEKGEGKRVNDVLDGLSLSRERHQWAEAFARQLNSVVRVTESARCNLLDVRNCVSMSLSDADTEIEKLEIELTELRKRKKLRWGCDMPKYVNGGDIEEERTLISPFSSSDTISFEIFSSCINVNERLKRQQQQQRVLSKCNEEPSRKEEDDDVLQDPASRKRRTGKR